MTTEEERISQIKDWWKEYRWSIIGGVGLGIAALGGWTGWNEYSRVQQESASAFYQTLSVAVVEENYETANESMRSLLDEHPETAYTGQGLLLMARASYENGNAAESKDYLWQAINESKESSTVHTARIRLAQLLLSESKYDEALNVLNVTDMENFDSHYHELRGDAHRGLKQYDDAHKAYQSSIDHLAPGSPYESILRLKLNDTLISE